MSYDTDQVQFKYKKFEFTINGKFGIAFVAISLVGCIFLWAWR